MVADKLHHIKSTLPQGVKLIAVSKKKAPVDILEAYQAGQRDFGENYVQELTDKYEELPKDIHWHFIGHLQRNKVKYIAPFVHLIHGIDSLKLLLEVNKQGKKINRVIPVLLQIHIAKEESKFGLDEQELKELLTSDEFLACENVNVRGLMGMATFTKKVDQIKAEFKELQGLYHNYRKHPHLKNHAFTELSMGMSQDYTEAINFGSTMVRIGSLIFGERN